MCLDYRKVHKQLTTDTHPLPNLEELVEHVAGNQYYTTLDLKNAYYQVLPDEASRDLTTFSEGINLYRFKRLSFGLSCSASIFVRQLQGALAPLLRQGWVKSYLDDIILCAPNFQLLLKRLGEVSQYMGEVGIKVNLSKCSRGQREVKFLGHIVSEEGFRPDPGNVEAIVNMKLPTNVKETRRFLGMVLFYRKQIDNFSHLAAQLTNLTRKNQPFRWTVDCQRAFEDLKDKLVTFPILVKANLSKRIILETDASQYLVAEVLLQYDDESLPRAVGYFFQNVETGRGALLNDR